MPMLRADKRDLTLFRNSCWLSISNSKDVSFLSTIVTRSGASSWKKMRLRNCRRWLARTMARHSSIDTPVYPSLPSRRTRRYPSSPSNGQLSRTRPSHTYTTTSLLWSNRSPSAADGEALACSCCEGLAAPLSAADSAAAGVRMVLCASDCILCPTVASHPGPLPLLDELRVDGDGGAGAPGGCLDGEGGGEGVDPVCWEEAGEGARGAAGAGCGCGCGGGCVVGACAVLSNMTSSSSSSCSSLSPPSPSWCCGAAGAGRCC
mmetsp:Transcript_12058/g.34959  ORF Transcript_12058/g.34959 Transcript_12058/m.34959 type:complete len:262 (+) Transcript_12058:324-1109(+)